MRMVEHPHRLSNGDSRRRRRCHAPNILIRPLFPLPASGRDPPGHHRGLTSAALFLRGEWCATGKRYQSSSPDGIHTTITGPCGTFAAVMHIPVLNTFSAVPGGANHVTSAQGSGWNAPPGTKDWLFVLNPRVLFWTLVNETRSPGGQVFWGALGKGLGPGSAN